jgi:hypothetical protein
MHAAPAVGDFASGPSLPWGDAGWTVDLTLTADGFLDATLSTVVGGQFLGGGGTTAASGGATAASGGIFGLGAAAQGGAGGVSGFDAATAGGGTAPDASAISPDAGAMIATITIHGPIGSVCGVRDPSGTVMPTRNGVFKLPCQAMDGLRRLERRLNTFTVRSRARRPSTGARSAKTERPFTGSAHREPTSKFRPAMFLAFPVARLLCDIVVEFVEPDALGRPARLDSAPIPEDRKARAG